MKADWDDPDNPVVSTVRMAGGVTINVRERDVEFAELLGSTAESCAIARQPLFHGVDAFDLAEDDR
jgi:hypothetical protein